MQEFRIRPDGFKEIRKKMLVRLIPFSLIILIAGILITTLAPGAKKDDISVLPFIIPFMLGAVSLGLYRGVKKQKIKFDSYLLTITANLISREQHNTPVVAIYFNDVKEIVKHKSGWFTVRGKEAVDIILIPSQVENYSDVEAVLNKIKPVITQTKQTWVQKLQGLLTFVALGLMICVYTVNNKIVVGIAAPCLIALLAWSFFKIRNSRNIDYRAKRGVWWMLILLFSIIAVMIIKLTA